MNKKVVAGAIIGGVVICGIAGYSTAVNTLESQAKDAIQETVNKSADLMKFTYKDLDVNVFDSSVTISDAVFTPAVDLVEPLNMKIKTLKVSNIKNQEFQPSLCYEMTGVEFPMAPLYAEDSDFKMLKYGESVSGNISGCYDFNIKEQTLSLQDYQIDFDGFYKIRVAFDFEDLDFGLTQTELDTLTEDELFLRIQKRVEDDPMSMLYSLTGTTIATAEYEMVDRGFLNRFIDVYAAETGYSEQRVREEYLRHLEMISEEFGRSAFGLQLLAHIEAYIKGETTTMTLAASPKPPVAFRELESIQDLDDASRRLNLSLKK